MVSGGLLLQEKYKFSFFSIEPGSLLHHTSDVWYKRIASKEGFCLVGFGKERQKFTLRLHWQCWAPCTMYPNGTSAVRRQLNGHRDRETNPILPSHRAGTGIWGRSKPKCIQPEGVQADCSTPQATKELPQPSLSRRSHLQREGQLSHWGDPAGFCAALRASKQLPALPQAREDRAPPSKPKGTFSLICAQTEGTAERTNASRLKPSGWWQEFQVYSGYWQQCGDLKGKGKGSRQSRRSLWLNWQLLSMLKTKSVPEMENKYTQRTTRAFPGSVEMQFESKTSAQF